LSTTATPTEIVILGAGPAGLGAAYQLAKQRKARVTVVEQRDTVGGAAGSFEVGGVRVDHGSHRLHPECDPAILADLRALLGDDLLLRPRHGRIRLRGRWIHFPLKPLDLLRRLPPGFVLGAAADAVTGPLRRRRREPETFASVLERGIGPTICRDFYFPYAEKVWGVPVEDISPVQARRRVTVNSPSKLLARVARGMRRKAPASFYWPRRGYGQIAEHLREAAERSGATVLMGTRVEAVETLGGRAVAVRARRGDARERLAASHVWSTVPMTTLVRLIEPAPPAAVREAAASLRFRAIVLVYLVLEAGRFSEYDAHYFPEADVAISRLSEPKNYAALTEPRDRTVLCAEVPCDVGDAVWAMSDEELRDLVAASLARAGIPLRVPVAEVTTRRLSHGYPVYLAGFERHFDAVDAWLGEIDGLLTFGRQGLFAHDNTHHALHMAYAAVASLGMDGRFDRERWSAFRAVFDKHVVVD